MTPNQPLIANKALWLASLPAGFVPQSEAFNLIAQLATVITHNAGQMNKLVDRVAELEAQLKPAVPVTKPTPVTTGKTKLVVIDFMGKPTLALEAANGDYYVTH